MKTLTLLLVLLSAPVAASYAQDASAPEGAIVETAEVSGFPINQLSPGLRESIRALVDQPLDFTKLAELTDRIEAERPEVVAAVRTVSRPNGKAQVIFLVARISDDPGLTANINTRYVVASVGIDGVLDERISQALRDDLQKLVGSPLDNGLADQLAERLKVEVPGHSVGRRISRATEREKIRVVFEFRRIEPPAWIAFTPRGSKLVYQEDIGWTGVLNIPVSTRNHQFTFGAVFGDKDTLIENQRGYQLRIENQKLGTKRLGASLAFSSLHEKWTDATVQAVAADPQIPALYRTRRRIEPLLTFAPDPRIRVSVGVSATELGPREESGTTESVKANAFVFSLGGGQRWRQAAGGSHRVDASYGVRSSALDSDLSYKRHAGDARYEFNHRGSAAIASFAFGHISGSAPLFERFSLGNTSTLRGWNKFDIAPAGGRNMWHQSLEYRFHGFGMFLDSGSVWEPGAVRKTRVSTGFGFQRDNFFLTWGIPLNATKVSTTFMLGVRF